MRRPFAIVACAALLALVAAPAFALESHATAPSESTTTEAGANDAALIDPGTPHPGTTPARSKYVHSTAPAAATGGSEDDASVGHNSVRNSKWHSYLPGMFR